MEACLYVAPSDRTVLERLIVNGKTPQKLAVRARIVLFSGRGFGTMAIAREARVSKPTVWRWQEAYLEGGVERLRKDKGKGPKAGKPRISNAVRLKIVTMTAKEKPANATHWSARMLAKKVGVGHTTVQRVWKEHGLKPISRARSSSRTIRNLQRKCRISLGFISIRRTMRWCYRLTKRARYKRLIAPSRACP